MILPRGTSRYRAVTRSPDPGGIFIFFVLKWKKKTLEKSTELLPLVPCEQFCGLLLNSPHLFFKVAPIWLIFMYIYKHFKSSLESNSNAYTHTTKLNIG